MNQLFVLYSSRLAGKAERVHNDTRRFSLWSLKAGPLPHFIPTPPGIRGSVRCSWRAPELQERERMEWSEAILCQVPELRTHAWALAQTKANVFAWLQICALGELIEPREDHVVLCPPGPHSLNHFERNQEDSLSSLLQSPTQTHEEKRGRTTRRSPSLLFVFFWKWSSSTAAISAEANKPCYLSWHPQQPERGSEPVETVAGAHSRNAVAGH